MDSLAIIFILKSQRLSGFHSCEGTVTDDDHCEISDRIKTLSLSLSQNYNKHISASCNKYRVYFSMPHFEVHSH